MNDTYQTISNYLYQHNVTLVAVSKTKPAQTILELYNTGQKDFGENRVQELKEKYEILPKDIRWHLIGHLQKNKVKYIAPWIYLIHSVDSTELLMEINKQAEKSNRIIPCLLQIYIAKEETKFGLDETELFKLLDDNTNENLGNIRIDGLMGMATNTENEETVRNEFRYLKSLFDITKSKYFPNADHFKHLSMGMSSDYKIGMEEGSTMVRIGSLLFGERN
ncbi:MAG: YggS family pyridoxal phosphate-dependent enzyme [Fimbriimonadaceae bacterium]|nr:YggS family pyridoxal phosphate-dependent enzyme [Chitinophagales bacterium]